MITLPVRVLVLGATGMLRNALPRVFAANKGFMVAGLTWSGDALLWFPLQVQSLMQSSVSATDFRQLSDRIAHATPNVIINAVGMVKQLKGAKDPTGCIELNALLPHRLAELCERTGAKLIQLSTNCVFSGSSGGNTELDPPNPGDLYFRSKLLDRARLPNAITLRPSINRSLDASRSRDATGYEAPSWPDPIGFPTGESRKLFIFQHYTRESPPSHHVAVEQPRSALWVKRGLLDKHGQMQRAST